ncbi:uncharacterized protein B4U80_10646 [Leptotrombidium deliense]|uniref:MULE transposase domain-containing protein n=1 Tax=Leptotrombidium deliense TaxID=299467 RepID=A0A443S9F3_9ACAR|nr:uncharacterized protein B4U80_10646 [Leptotrombidium deliense]
MTLEYIKSQRGKDLLIIENYLFEKDKDAKNDPNTSYWRCQTRSCKERVSVVSGELSRHNIIHTHPDHSEAINKKRKLKIFKEAAGKNPGKGMKRVYDETIRNEVDAATDRDEAIAQMPPFKQIGRTMYRALEDILPKEPKSRSEIKFEGVWLQTVNNQQFVAINDGMADKIIVLCTEKFGKRLAQAKKIFSDGTFKSVPKLFEQLYTFHVKEDKQMIPVAYCLLPNKSSSTYERLLTLLRNWIASLGFIFKPDEIMIDFEQAMIKAINKVFPTTRVRGCLFHYRQAIYRHVQECGLSAAYNEPRAVDDDGNEIINDVRKAIRRFLGLPFLPVNEIEDAHTEMMEHVDLNDARISSFCDYHLDTWMKDDAKFPKEIWNQYGNFCDRTNNLLFFLLLPDLLHQFPIWCFV